MGLLKFLVAALLTAAMLSVLVALFVAVFWGFLIGPLWMGVVSGAGILGWYWMATGRRNPRSPEDFKDFGI